MLYYRRLYCVCDVYSAGTRLLPRRVPGVHRANASSRVHDPRQRHAPARCVDIIRLEVEQAVNRSKIKEGFVGVCLAFWSLVLLFMLLEVAARVFLFHFAGKERFFRYASIDQILHRYPSANHPLFTHSPHRYLGHYPSPNYKDGKNRHNVLGYRGEEIVLPKPQGEFRIACLGSSSTYTGWVDDYRITYPAILESELRGDGYQVSVINAGNEAWTSYETLINFAFRVLYLEPDLIIVYHGVNDILARVVWPPEAYASDNAGFRGPNISDLAMPNVLEHSTLLRALAVKTGLIAPHATLFRTYDAHSPTFYGFEWRDQKIRGVYPRGVFTKVTARQMLETNKPVYFRRNMESLAAMADHYGIATVFATFAYSPEFPEEPWVASDEIQWAYEESNQVLRDVAKRTGAVLFDFAKAFPTDRALFADGIHVNKVGARRKGELCAEFLRESGLIPERYREPARASPFHHELSIASASTSTTRRLRATGGGIER